MPRKGPKSQDETVETPEPTEAPAQENTESTTESTEDTIDLTAFEAAVKTAIDNRDQSNGDLRSEDQEAVVAEYRKLDGQKPRNAAKRHLEDGMRTAIRAKDVVLANGYVELKDALSAAAPRKDRPAANPTDSYVQTAFALRLAANLQAASQPEGVAENWQEQLDEFTKAHAEEVEAYRQYVEGGEEGDEPEVHAAVREAFKRASKRVGKGGGKRANAGGPRRNVKNHIREVFAGVEVGTTLTVNQISKADSKEYGEDHPSAGAVTQALFPKGDKPHGIEGIETSDDKPRGATKVAA